MIQIKANQVAATSRVWTATGACLAVWVLLIVISGCDGLPSIIESSEDEDRADTSSKQTVDRDDAGSSLEVVGSMPISAESVAPYGDVTPVRLNLEAPVPVKTVDVTIGSPGLWPPREFESSTGEPIILPVVRARPYGGRDLTHYEVRAVGAAGDETYAYWGEVDFGEEALVRTVRMRPAGPLEVRVLDEAGKAISGASVRLSRGLVGLVNLATESGDRGRAGFGGIPGGDYRLTVEADGYVRSVRHVLRVGGQGQELDVELERGATVRGYVRDASGRPIPGAEVAIYPESPFANTAVDTSFLADLGVWSQVATTDFGGDFVARGIGADAVRVGASAPGYAPALSDLIRFGASDEATVDLVLREGRGLRVRVVDETDEPVPGATVQWESLEDNGGRSASTNESGLASFDSVPEHAFVRAELGSWTSRRRNVPAREDGEVVEVELTLTKPVAESAIRLRLSSPPGVSVDSAVLEMTDGDVCLGDEIEETIWRFDGCDPGLGTLHTETRARGSYGVEKDFAETEELTLPDLVEAKVLLQGLRGREWRDATLGWRWGDNEWRGAEFAEERTSARRVWKRDLLPGRYELFFEHPATGEQRFEFELDGDRRSRTWTLERRATVPIFVTDAQGAPVSNALVQIWEDGRLLREGYSRGASALSVRLTPPVDARVLALDARRGESERSLTIESGAVVDDIILELDDPLFSSELPPGRITDVERMSDILEAALVQDGSSWLVDATDPDSEAIEAGLERGDRVLWVREIDERYSVAVERGRDIVEVSISK